MLRSADSKPQTCDDFDLMIDENGVWTMAVPPKTLRGDPVHLTLQDGTLVMAGDPDITFVDGHPDALNMLRASPPATLTVMGVDLDGKVTDSTTLPFRMAEQV